MKTSTILAVAVAVTTAMARAIPQMPEMYPAKGYYVPDLPQEAPTPESTESWLSREIADDSLNDYNATKSYSIREKRSSWIVDRLLDETNKPTEPQPANKTLTGRSMAADVDDADQDAEPLTPLKQKIKQLSGSVTARDNETEQDTKPRVIGGEFNAWKPWTRRLGWSVAPDVEETDEEMSRAAKIKHDGWIME
ncbi:hypothetical protein B0J13DRAFT_643916 [Dactylonectria estremocensis]|uniref:Uncharacterized protein n=1 Tax=Dactylonectria estremocensis TaxID=1079267 RepID=A0A9P9FDJ5_9HYPO|nr:hypothetical protein B0J13DRAFT_643916 [Dactylonectria estremocensis]